MNSNDGTLTKHLFNTEGLERGEDNSQGPVTGQACSEATMGTCRTMHGPPPPICIQKHLPSLKSIRASVLNKTLKHESEISTYLLKKEVSDLCRFGWLSMLPSCHSQACNLNYPAMLFHSS